MKGTAKSLLVLMSALSLAHHVQGFWDPFQFHNHMFGQPTAHFPNHRNHRFGRSQRSKTTQVTAFTERNSDDLLVEISGPNLKFTASDISFSLEDDVFRITRDCSHGLSSFFSGHCTDFRKAVKVPSLFDLDEVTGQWKSKNKLLLRLPGAARKATAESGQPNEGAVVEQLSNPQKEQRRSPEQRTKERKSKESKDAHEQTKRTAKREAKRAALEAKRQAKADREAAKAKQQEEREIRMKVEKEAQQQAQRLRQAQKAADREAREKEAREKEAREKEAREKEAREKAAREKAAREKAARDEVARENAARENAARENAARENAAREKEQRKKEKERLAQENVEAQKKLEKCRAGMKVQARDTISDNRYQTAQVLAIDPEAERLVVAWGNNGVSTLPLEQAYINGCSVHGKEDAQKPRPHTAEPIEGEDDWIVIEDLEHEDDLEKDGDASEGYYLFGEFHFY